MKRIFMFIMGLIFLASCGSDEQSARLEIRLTDAPGDYEAVFIDIQGVEINTEEGDQGWKQLEVNKGIYNLLEFRNGMDTLLATAVLPAGKVSQIRLLLGDENSVVIDSTEFDLNTPSAQHSGLQ